MQNMKKKACDDANINGGGVQGQKQKERHIVSWSQEEDDILRDQISIHGTDNWAIVASKFKDKTTRQCRRRWFTYLNSDFKKGGWTQEEDMLLCEAQKIFGNRWTEIAKVVSGRTDNAVKNRFSTLCKKRAKNEALAKENNTSYISTNKKRTRSHNGQQLDTVLETSMPPSKLRRKHIPDTPEDYQQLRPPFSVILHNCHNLNTFTAHLNAKSDVMSKDGIKVMLKVLGRLTSKDNYEPETPSEQPLYPNWDMGKVCVHPSLQTLLKSGNIRGTFLKKDDPKIIALLQQAELLSSLALKVNTEKTNESYENACKAVQDFLKQTKESDVLGFNISDMDIRSCDEGSQQSWRQPDLYQGSPDSSDYSTASSVLSQVVEKTEQFQDNIVDGKLNIIPDSTTNHGILASCDELSHDVNDIYPLPNSEFDSPLQVTPLFRSMAAGIPSPQFSESERSFLLKTLGMESTPPNHDIKTSQPPHCKRALLHCL